MAAHTHQPAFDAKGLLRHAKMRVTAVRVGIIRLLAQTPQALDAQEIERRLDAEATDRVTVYRTLNSLVEAGLAHRVDPGDRVFRYSLTDHSGCSDLHHQHDHPHVVCDSCGKVECLDNATVLIRPAKGSRGEATARSFRVSQQKILLHGTCEQCDRVKR
ncbi:MAG: Fur family transcriptional regulator [Phycisphaerales bacterium]